MQLLGLLAIPLVVASLAWILARDSITRGEFLAQLLLSTILIIAAWSWARTKSLDDVEHFNGRVSEKSAGTQPCCHCHRECVDRYFFGLCKRKVDRCKHPRDHYWRVVVDGAGTLEETCLRSDKRPAWWSKVRTGQPAVIEHHYQNYLRADPDSLMHRGFDGQHEGEATREAAIERFEIPPFPAVHDGIFVDRVIELGNEIDAPAQWQAQLDELNAELGASHQVDVTVVLGTSDGPELALAVDAAWLSGPKNAAIVVLGAPDRQTIAWARLVSVSQNPELEIAVRERLRGLRLDDPRVIHRAVELEAAVSAQYQANQNKYDEMWKVIQETAQVPDKYKDDFKEVLDTEVPAKYGPNGSKALFQWFEDRDLKLPEGIYARVQDVIEGNRAEFRQNQDIILDQQRAYRAHLGRFGHGFLARIGGFPRPVSGTHAPSRDTDGDGKMTVFDYEIVTSARTAKAFESSRDDKIDVFE